MEEIGAIGARLAALEAERDVLSTLYRYGHAIDYGLAAEWLDCFTEDAEYDLRYRTGLRRRRLDGGTPTAQGVVYRGQGQLASFIAGHSHAPDRWHKHFLVEPAVALLGEHATAASYFARIDEHEGQPRIMAFGRYLDRLRRCPDGRWRFEQRVAEIEVLAS